MKALAGVVTCIILLTGVQHSLLYSFIGVNLIIGITISLGVLGLYVAGTSYRARDRNMRWLLLMVGILSVLISHNTLETLLRL